MNYTSATCDELKLELDEFFAKELNLGRISRVLVKPKCIPGYLMEQFGNRTQSNTNRSIAELNRT